MQLNIPFNAHSTEITYLSHVRIRSAHAQQGIKQSGFICLFHGLMVVVVSTVMKIMIASSRLARLRVSDI